MSWFDWLLKWIGGISAALFGLSLFSAAGCGINPNLTDEQQQKDADLKMAWLDKAVEIAERHNIAYRIEVNATGRPSIGESIDLYFDSGLSTRVIMFGNGAGARPPVSLPGDQP